MEEELFNHQMASMIYFCFGACQIFLAEKVYKEAYEGKGTRMDKICLRFGQTVGWILVVVSLFDLAIIMSAKVI